MQKIGDKIKVLISSKGWKLGDFAISIGYDRAAFSRAINSDTVTAKLISKVAVALGIPVDAITGPTEYGPGNMPAWFEAPDMAAQSKVEEPEVEYLKNRVAVLEKQLAQLIDSQAEILKITKPE